MLAQCSDGVAIDEDAFTLLDHPGHVLIDSHLQYEFASTSDIGVCKPRLVPWLAVESGGLYVFVLRRYMVRLHSENLAIAHRDAAAREDGASNLVDCAPRALRIEAQRAEDIPGRGLSAIVITGNPETAISIPDVQQLPDTLLCLPRLAGEVVEIWDVKSSARCPARTGPRDQSRRDTDQGRNTSKYRIGPQI